MFANAFQNGPTLEVWDARVNVDKNQFYKQLFRLLPNSNAKYFDKEVKSYLYMLENQNTRMLLPADDTKMLALHQRYLVLHIFIPIGFSWAVEFTLTDVNGIKRRINITTTQGKQEVKYFSFRYPIDNLKKGVWLFLGIDIYSFMGVFKDQTFRSLDQISVSNSCKLRRIFTMKEFVQFEIPKNYWLCQSIPQEFQLISMKGGLKEIGEVSKQLTQSISSPKKKDFSPQNNKSSINDSREGIGKKRQNLIKSEVIIENAKIKIESLAKEEEKLLQRSRQLQADSSIRFPKERSKILSRPERQKPFFQDNRLKVAANKQKKSTEAAGRLNNSGKSSEKPSTKLPQIQISFKQDSALNIQYQQSSNFTEQHIKANTPKTPKDIQSKQIIQEDRWSQEERQPSRPISQAISGMTGNFPSTVITKQNNKEIVVTKANKKQLQLIYDQMVGCYYHPQTNSYYDLRQ